MQFRMFWFLVHRFSVCPFCYSLFPVVFNLCFFFFSFRFFARFRSESKTHLKCYSLCTVYHVRKIDCAITCYWFNGISVTMWMTSLLCSNFQFMSSQWYRAERCLEHWAFVVKRIQFDWLILMQWREIWLIYVFSRKTMAHFSRHLVWILSN